MSDDETMVPLPSPYGGEHHDASTIKSTEYIVYCAVHRTATVYKAQCTFPLGRLGWYSIRSKSKPLTVNGL